jgi:hypothetical protein
MPTWTQASRPHPFGPPPGYELVHEGRCDPPKAVIELACRSLLGRIRTPEEFSGGETPGQANFVLRHLGFTVERFPPSEGGVEGGSGCQPLGNERVVLLPTLERPRPARVAR